MIRPATEEDYAAIVGIYNHYIKESIATFEVEPVSTGVMQQRVETTQHSALPWLVAEDEGGNVVGYAYASKWKERVAYRQSVEVSVYLDHRATVRGLGTKLYSALFAELAALPIHAVMAGISLPNEGSVALHEKFGMKKVAHFSEVGRKFDQWIDVGYWQVLLDS